MERERIKEILYILPLALIIGIIPLIVRYKEIKLGKFTASYWIKDVNTDFFSYYKMWLFLIFVIMAFISLYIYLKKEKKYKKTLYYFPVTVYMLMIVISTVLSECKYTSLTGFPDRYEGMPVLLGYMLIIIITINLIQSKTQIKFLLNVLLISAVIIGIIGLFQFFGLDFFQSHVAQKLIIPASGYEEIVSKLNYRFAKNDLVYTTLYNPNNVGSYFVMLFILTFVLYFFADSRKNKIFYGAVNLLMFENWLGSLSRAGILGGLISLILLVLLLRNELKKRWRSLVIICICFFLVFTVMNFYTGGLVSGEFISLGKETKVAVSGKVNRIEEIRTEDGSLIFITEENILNISFARAGNLHFSDGKGNDLDYSSKKINGEEYIKVDAENYRDFKFKIPESKIGDLKVFELDYDNKQANFIYDPAFKNYLLTGMNGNIYPVQGVESWGFKGKEQFASGRGYIWSRSLPLLKKTIFKGFGPDTYPFYFPQEDVIGKFKTFRTPTRIVDKPHNMYLQFALNTGVLSLIAVILLFTTYFIRNLRIYWKSNYENWFAGTGTGIFVAVVGYAIAGLFNDSVISVAPVFWALLGTGIAVELKLNSYENY